MANATNRLFSFRWRCLWRSPAARPAPPCAPARKPIWSEDYDRAIVEYTRRCARIPTTRRRALALERAKVRAALDHYARAGDRSGRQAGRGAGRVADRRRAEPRQRRHRRRAAQASAASSATRSPSATARPTRDADRKSRDLQPAGPGAADRHPDARLADVPRRQRRATSSRARQDRRRQRRLRSAVPRSAGDHRSAEHALEDALQAVASSTRNFYRVTAQRTITVDPGHAGQAPRIRGRDRPHVLS